MTDVTNQLAVPAGLTVKLDGLHLTVKGPKGSIDRTYKMSGVTAKLNGSQIVVTGTLREVNTLSAHINNALRGASSGYSQKLKVVYAHFPVALEIKPKVVVIKNFLGEKQPRHADIIGSTKVEVKGTEVFVTGPDRDDVGQTIANMRIATKIRNRDSRVFQDGIYPVDS